MNGWERWRFAPQKSSALHLKKVPLLRTVGSSRFFTFLRAAGSLPFFTFFLSCSQPARADYTPFESCDSLVTEAVRTSGLPECYRFLPLLLTDCDSLFVGRYASGAWALSVPAAHRYGLMVNDSIDERHIIRKSTLAATHYLRDLRRHFNGNDTLALCQYVRTLPVLRVSADSLLPALERIGEEYGRGHRRSGFLAPLDGVREDAVRRDSLQKLERERRAAELAARKPVVGKTSTGGFITYKVKKGDYLGRIAQRHHVTVSQLKKWNNLRSDFIREGQKLKIMKK